MIDFNDEIELDPRGFIRVHTMVNGFRMDISPFDGREQLLDMLGIKYKKHWWEFWLPSSTTVFHDRFTEINERVRGFKEFLSSAKH